MYKLTKKEEKQWCHDLIACDGFINSGEKYELSFNRTHLHRNCFEAGKDSD